MTEDFATVARTAAEAAGGFLRERFTDGTTDADYRTTDVKAHADEEAERLVVETIREHYPDHPITAEEAGHLDGDGDHRWVVDALDGTNNFVAGLPTFGAAVTVVDDADDPVAAAVSVPAVDDLYVARRGDGVRYNGRPVRADDGETPPVEAGTVAFVIGSPVVYDGPGRENADEIRWELGQTAKRCIQTWAPVVHWGLLARGAMDGYVCLHPDEREQLAGALLATEAGCAVRREGPLSAFAPTQDAADALFETAATVREPIR
ncbi:inositol monophosphatase family protein [Haloarcula litorea]|uniref:inositol monophosphatase family protein n=1 Tax=Haloarcula litorea TaxID=3032579 RepID=UPI0023E8FB14|nr:inositol monophosphatase family protein [Halomicroarcula sp. GDY20]